MPKNNAALSDPQKQDGASMPEVPSSRRNCFVCGGKEHKEVEGFANSLLFIEDAYFGIDIKKVMCSGCGLIYASTYPGMEYLKRLYVTFNASPEEISYRFSAAPGHNEFFLDRLNRMHAGGKKRILDVGCGRCATLDRFKSAGWETYGADISPLSMRTGKEKGHSVWCGPFEKLDFGALRFDAILFEASFEHMLDPVLILKKAKTLLTENGTIAMSFPDAYACLESKNVYDILREDHCNHFTRGTIERVLAGEGFAIAHSYLDKDAPLPDMKIIAAEKSRVSRITPGYPGGGTLEGMDRAVGLYREMRSNVRTALRSRISRLKKVAVYCAGTYTTIILPAFFGFDFSKCAAFIDNDPKKQGKNIYGRTILGHKALAGLDIDAVLISSETFEDEICEALEKEGHGFELIKLNALLKGALAGPLAKAV